MHEFFYFFKFNSDSYIFLCRFSALAAQKPLSKIFFFSPLEVVE